MSKYSITDAAIISAMLTRSNLGVPLVENKVVTRAKDCLSSIKRSSQKDQVIAALNTICSDLQETVEHEKALILEAKMWFLIIKRDYKFDRFILSEIYPDIIGQFEAS